MTDIQEVAQGKVPAEASLWRIYFPVGQTPKDSAVRRALGATRAVKVTQMSRPSVVTYDESVDEDMVTIEPAPQPEPVRPDVAEHEFEENLEHVLRQQDIPRIVEVSGQDPTETNQESE